MITAFKVKVTAKAQYVGDCPCDIFWTAEYFVTKLGIVMQHHEPECQAEHLVHRLQCQGHSEGVYMIKKTTLSTISSELLTPWQPNLVLWYIVISHSVLWEKKKTKRITALKVKDTVKGQNVNVFPDNIF